MGVAGKVLGVALGAAAGAAGVAVAGGAVRAAQQRRMLVARDIHDTTPFGSLHSDPITVVDYLYLGQLPKLLFSNDVWAEAKVRLGNASDTKQRLNDAISYIAPVRNSIAHVREVPTEQLQKAHVACNDVLAMAGKV